MGCGFPGGFPLGGLPLGSLRTPLRPGRVEQCGLQASVQPTSPSLAPGGPSVPKTALCGATSLATTSAGDLPLDGSLTFLRASRFNGLLGPSCVLSTTCHRWPGPLSLPWSTPRGSCRQAYPNGSGVAVGGRGTLATLLGCGCSTRLTQSRRVLAPSVPPT